MIQQGEQGTLAWHRARHGKITGSAVGDIMKSGRKKDEIFGDTAKSYLRSLTADRLLNRAVFDDDELYQGYIDRKFSGSKATRWGHEWEDEAKDTFFREREIPEEDIMLVGSCAHDTIPNFAASPDALIKVDGKLKVIEVKCPNSDTFVKYALEIHDWESLKAVKPEYYWQMQAEMDCTGAGSGIFIAYDPHLSKSMHTALIMRNEVDIKLMEERIIAADSLIEEYKSKILCV